MRSAKTFRSKKEFVYDTLREQILGAELDPESRLIIDDIAANLGVSPIPVREALQQLQSDGLVTIEPYIGARVSAIQQGLVEEVFGLLEALEVVSGRAACTRMSEEDFASMENFLRQMDAQLDDPEGWSANNVQLHQMIADWADMQLVQSMFQRVADHWNRLRRTYLVDVFSDRIAHAHRDHWRLIEALRTRNPDHVEEVVRDHNRRALDSYLVHLA